MKILLACSAGMSTSLLEKSINEYMKEQGIKGTAKAFDSSYAKQIIQDYDVLLLGPQVRFMKAEFTELAGKVPVDVIPPHVYALAKGKEVYEQAAKLAGK